MLVADKNPDVTSYGMSLDLSVAPLTQPKKNLIKRYKRRILIRLTVFVINLGEIQYITLIINNQSINHQVFKTACFCINFRAFQHPIVRMKMEKNMSMVETVLYCELIKIQTTQQINRTRKAIRYIILMQNKIMADSQWATLVILEVHAVRVI